jgi:hypothetical protein
MPSLSATLTTKLGVLTMKRVWISVMHCGVVRRRETDEKEKKKQAGAGHKMKS